MNPRTYNFGEVIVKPGSEPVSMQLLCHGICDVIWMNAIKVPVAEGEVLTSSPKNPLNKFDKEIHGVIEEIHKTMTQLSIPEQSVNLNDQDFHGRKGFKVQRLTKGDAITVRGLAEKGSYSHMSASKEISVVAASSSVKTFELSRESVQFLPPEIRVKSESSAINPDRQQRLL